MAVSFNDDKAQAPRMKSFIMFRCGHRFHNNCILEKLKIQKEKKGIREETKEA